MELVFQFGNEMIIIKIRDGTILFSNSTTNFQQFVTIDGLKLTKEGILKEHPDLKDLNDTEMKAEAIKRFKDHVKALGNENKIKDYVVKELGKSGYILKVVKKEGFRPIKIK